MGNLSRGTRLDGTGLDSMNQKPPQMSLPAKRVNALQRSAQPQSGNEKTIIYIRRLIWLYLILLIFEGSLRKWVVPQFSDPLLIVRDPIVILIYILALRARVFPWNGYIVSLLIISILSIVLSVFRLWDFIPPTTIALITGYGFRSNFLHLPLVFVMAKVLNEVDVKNIGRWTLLGMIPMGLLMIAQFRAPAESFINRAAGFG
jgi:hypothetical protein